MTPFSVTRFVMVVWPWMTVGTLTSLLFPEAASKVCCFLARLLITDKIWLPFPGFRIFCCPGDETDVNAVCPGEGVDVGEVLVSSILLSGSLVSPPTNTLSTDVTMFSAVVVVADVIGDEFDAGWDVGVAFCFVTSGASFSFVSGFLAALSLDTTDVFPGPRRLMILTSLPGSGFGSSGLSTSILTGSSTFSSFLSSTLASVAAAPTTVTFLSLLSIFFASFSKETLASMLPEFFDTGGADDADADAAAEQDLMSTDWSRPPRFSSSRTLPTDFPFCSSFRATFDPISDASADEDSSISSFRFRRFRRTRFFLNIR